jgi:hypothetical protein
MRYQLHANAHAERLVTGCYGFAEKTYRGQAYRIEVAASGLRLFRDGQQVRSWDDIPPAIQKIARDAKRVLIEAVEMAR